MKKRSICFLFIMLIALLLSCSACKKKTYEITFDSNGGSFVSSQEVKKNATISKPDNPTKEGYIFLYWEFNGAEYNFNTPIVENIILVAKWEKEESPQTKFIVTFDTNGGTIIDSQTIDKGSKITIPKTPEKEGYVFEKWQINGVDYNFDESVNKDLTLVAVWKPIPENSKLVLYEIDGNIIQQNIVKNDSEDMLKPKIPEKEGYEGKWIEKESTSSKVVFYIEYIIIEYKVTFKIEDVIVGEDIYTVEDKEVEEPLIPEKEGYEGKWEEYELTTGNLIIKCEYIAIEYKVTFKIGEEIVGIDTYTVEDKEVEEPKLETVEGYIFRGWYLNDLEFNKELLTTGDIVLEGYWETEYSNGLEYSLNEDSMSYTVVGKGTWEGTNLIIPEEYKDLPVTIIGRYAFSNCYNIESISLSNNIVAIRDGAFASCCSLTNVEIPESVKTIGSTVFMNCSNLQSITLPFIGNSEDATAYRAVFGYIFGYDTRKNSRDYKYEFSESYIDTQYGSAPDNSTWQYSCYEKDPYSNIYYATSYYYFVPESLKSVTITKQNIIPIAAFKNCTSLEEINYVNGVIGVSVQAFNNCNNLKYNTYDNANYLGSLNNPYFMLVKAVNTEITGCEIHNDAQYILTDAFEGCNLLNYNTYDNANYLGSLNNPYLILVKAVDTNIVSCNIHNDTLAILNSAFNGCKYLENVNVPNGLKIIGDKVFYDCRELKNLDIPNSVTNIGVGILSNASNLSSLTLPFLGNNRYYDLYNYLGYSFGSKSNQDNGAYVPNSLKTVVITGGKNIGEKAFYNCQYIENISIIGEVENIKIYAFSECNNLISLTLGANIKSVESNFSYSQSKFSNVYYKGNLEQWCNISFTSSSSSPMEAADHLYMLDENDEWFEITELLIPETICEIGNYQFYGFKNVSKITIPNSVINIGSYAFAWCSNLTSIELSNSVTKIGEYAFLYSNIESIYIPESVVEIGFSAFSGCDNLKEMSLPFVGSTINEPEGGKTYLGYLFGATDKYDNSEYVVSSLKKVTVYGATNIDEAFYDCPYITEIILGDNVKRIGHYSLYGCKSLTKLTIPFVGESIEENKNSNLGFLFGQSSYIPSSLSTVIVTGGTTLGSFQGCKSLRYVEIPASVTKVDVGCFYECVCLISINVSGDNQNYCSIDGVLYSKNVDTIIKCPNSYLYSKLVIPNTVITIGASAFDECPNLTDLEIPNSVKIVESVIFSYNAQLNNIYFSGTIEEWLEISFDTISGGNPLQYTENFYMLDENSEYKLVTEIVIPNSVEYINQNQFSGLRNLEKVVIPSSVKNIGIGAFQDCPNLESVIFDGDSNLISIERHAFAGCASLKNISLPSGLKNIGNYVFYDCLSIREIIIPMSVETIGDYAFYYCDNLTKIYCEIDAQPEGWSVQWNASKKSVEWGYKE